jgi:glycosyltransferase involved in cell wall biosynthesis
MQNKGLSMPKSAVLILNHSYKSPFKELDIQYARLFSPDRYAVTIAYLTGQGTSEEIARYPDYDIIFLNLRKKDIRSLKLRAIRKLGDLCRERRFSIAICHRYKPTYIVFWATRRGPMTHLISVMHDFRTLQRLSHRLFVYFFLRHRFIFAGVSDAVRDDLYRDGWGLTPDQVITLPNTIDVPETDNRQLDRAEARRQLGIAPEAFVLGTVGRLHPAKDQATLIEALVLAADCRPDLTLVIVGDGPLEGALKERIARHRLGARVLLTGFIPQASRLMRAFDVYVSSSRKEPFGLVLLEAMAAALPIIATGVDGVPGVMGDCGLLIPPEDPEAMAEAIMAYCNRSATGLAELGRVNRQRLCATFTTDHFRQVFWRHFTPRGLEP